MRTLMTLALAALLPGIRTVGAQQPAPQAPNPDPVATDAPVPSLHLGITSAALVIVGKHAGVAPSRNDGLRLHRVQVLETIKSQGRGDSPLAVTLIDVPQASLHQRPVPQQTRLFCLLDASRAAAAANLPEAGGPYYRLSGHPGSNPLVPGDRERSAEVAFARILGDGRSERPLEETCDALLAVAQGRNVDLRREAVQVLVQHRAIRAKITDVIWSRLVARAVGETEDVAFKIALSELCAVENVPGLIEGLCMCMPTVTDPAFALFLGRAARASLGHNGAQLLHTHAVNARQKGIRDRFLLAMGATGDKFALDTLLRMRETAPEDSALDAALKAHGSPRAQEVLAKR